MLSCGGICVYVYVPSLTYPAQKQYVQLVTEMRMTQAIGAQINSFLDGIYSV